MKKTLLLVALLICVLVKAPALRAQAPQTYFIFKGSVTIPSTVLVVGQGNAFDKLVKKTFTTNDIVNLALGRKLGSKVDPAKEIFALATYFEDSNRPITNPISKVVIYDKTASGPARIKAVVATLDSLDFVNAYQATRNTGLGYATGKLVAATQGDPAKYGLLQTAITGSGLVSGGHSTLPTPQNGFQQKATTMLGTITFEGRLKFNTTDASNVTTVYDGIFNRGVMMFSGKLLDSVDY